MSTFDREGLAKRSEANRSAFETAKELEAAEKLAAYQRKIDGAAESLLNSLPEWIEEAVKAGRRRVSLMHYETSSAACDDPKTVGPQGASLKFDPREFSKAIEKANQAKEEPYPLTSGERDTSWEACQSNGEAITHSGHIIEVYLTW